MLVIPKAPKTTKKDKNLRAIKRPRGVEKTYRDQLFAVNAELEESLEPINTLLAAGAGVGDVTNQIEQQFQATSGQVDSAANTLSSSFVAQSNRTNKKSVENVYKRAFSVDSATIIDQPNVKEFLDGAIVENVSLIRTIHSDYWGDVIQAVLANFRGNPQIGGLTLQERIQKIGGIADNRAKVIARDQTKKLSSSLTRIRHQNVGVKKYIWHNSQDERVVGNPGGLYPKGKSIHLNHWSREGKIYFYSNPPADGNPGTPIECRCWEEPMLDTDNANLIIS